MTVKKAGAARVVGNRASLNNGIDMELIQPNCRVQFAAEDIEFIVSVLGGKLGDTECLVRLLADEESRDLILDDAMLLQALLEHRGCLQVSTHFYFYVLVRHVFLRAAIRVEVEPEKIPLRAHA